MQLHINLLKNMNIINMLFSYFFSTSKKNITLHINVDKISFTAFRFDHDSWLSFTYYTFTVLCLMTERVNVKETLSY